MERPKCFTAAAWVKVPRGPRKATSNGSSRANAQHICVSVDGDGADRGAKRGRLFGLLVERGRKNRLVEEAPVDHDAANPFHAARPQVFGDRDQIGELERGIAIATHHEVVDLPLTDITVEASPHAIFRTEPSKDRSGRQQFEVRSGVQRSGTVSPVQLGPIGESDHVDPKSALNARLRDQTADALFERGAVECQAGRRPQKRKHNEQDRSASHRTKPSRLALTVLLLALGCDRSVGSNDTDGALVVVLPRDAEQIDPRFVSDPYGLKVSRLVFASLFTIDPRTLEVISDLAESVKLETRTRYRVRLRKGLRFSDGSPLTSEDVLETYSGIVDPELRSRYAETYRRIKYVKVVDDRTIIFQLREPHATFLTDLEFPILRRQDARRPIGQLGAQAPIGAGPYRILERVPGRIELDANPHWHRGTPIHPRVRFVVMRDDNTRALRMLAGAGDIALGAVPPLLLPMFEEDPKFEVRSAPGIGTTYLGFNTRAAALRDLRVRRAIAHAIDRKALLEAKQDGRGKVTKTWIPSGHWAYTTTSRVIATTQGAPQRFSIAQATTTPMGSVPNRA